MTNENIIKYAADRSGMPYPLDEKSRELSESVLRSLDDGVAWANNKPHNMRKVNHQEYKKYLQRLANEP